jgi:glycosyltransferase involved in cell wall biosynthesis
MAEFRNQPQRILIVAWLQGPGGIETHLLTLSRLLVAHGAEVTIAARVCKTGVPLEAAAPAIPVTFLKTPFAHSTRWLRLSTLWAAAVWPLRFGGKFDVILTLERGPFTRKLRRSLKRGALVVGAYAGDMPSLQQADAARENCDALLVESEQHRKLFHGLLGPDFRIAVAPHLGYYAQPPARGPFHGGVLRIAFLGRFDGAKGVHRLLELWPKLSVRPAELHFYGGGPEEPALRLAIAARPVTGVFIHGGWAGGAELENILREVDLLVLPSESEGLPVILLEAMAHGVPFVAADVGAVRALGADNPDVAVVPGDDISLKGAISDVAARIRSGAISPRRLQRYSAERFSFETASSIWLEALLDPQSFWRKQSLRS